MYSGKLIFSQLFDHLPFHSFRQCVQRYQGNHKLKTFHCLDQYLCMAFGQLAYRESLRDIEACLRAQSSKLYHMGIRGGVSRNTLSNDNKVARLAHLRRFLPIPDPSCTSLVCRRGLSSGSGQHCICTGFINNRPVPVSLSLDAVPFNQIRRQIAHSAGLAWEYSNFHPHLQRKITRRKCPGYSGSGSRGILCHGSWLPGFRPSLPDEQRRRLLRDPQQIEHAVSSSLFPSSRQVNRSQMRPNHSADRKQIENRLPPTTPSRQVSRPRKRKNLRFPDQQCRNTGQNGSRSIPFSVESGTFFQMDKTAPADQIVLWNIRKCR